jgi:hypothetical protein
LNPGPSGEDADRFGQPRDVGSPILRQVRGSAEKAQTFPSPDQADLSSFGAQVTH